MLVEVWPTGRRLRLGDQRPAAVLGVGHRHRVLRAVLHRRARARSKVKEGGSARNPVHRWLGSGDLRDLWRQPPGSPPGRHRRARRPALYAVRFPDCKKGGIALLLSHDGTTSRAALQLDDTGDCTCTVS